MSRRGFAQYRLDREACFALFDPTLRSGSRAMVGDGTGGRHPFFHSRSAARSGPGGPAMLTPPEARRLGREARRNLPATVRRHASARLCHRFVTTPWYRHAQVIAIYFALPEEANLDGLVQAAIADGKTVIAPVIGVDGAMSLHVLRSQPIRNHRTVARDATTHECRLAQALRGVRTNDRVRCALQSCRHGRRTLRSTVCAHRAPGGRSACRHRIRVPARSTRLGTSLGCPCRGHRHGQACLQLAPARRSARSALKLSVSAVLGECVQERNAND